MIRGLDVFKKQFVNYSNSYVLIGGTACSLAMEEAGLDFRATKDFDVVLYVEALEKNFVRSFWEFVKSGKYQNRQESTGKRLFYRFSNPQDSSYPYMIELFSRKPDAVYLSKKGYLTPIPVSEEISSLSAILLDDAYYQFIHEGKREVDGVPILSPTHLIPLKAKAWLDLTSRQDSGGRVDDHDIRKHRNDVIRLFQLLSPKTQILLSSSMRDDMLGFLEGLKKASIDFKQLGLKRGSLSQVVQVLTEIYCAAPPLASN